MTEFDIIGRNLVRRPVRFILTSIAVFLAFLLFGLVGGLAASLDEIRRGDSTTNRLVVTNRVGLTQPLPIGYITRLENLEGVSAVSPAAIFAGHLGDPRLQIISFAVEPASWLAVYPEIRIPAAEASDFFEDRAGALVGRTLAQQFDWKVGDEIPLNSAVWINRSGSRVWSLIVRGIFEDDSTSAGSSYLILHYDYLNDARMGASNTFNWAVLTPAEGYTAEEMSAKIDSTFSNSPYETKTQTEGAFGAEFLKQFGDVALVLVLVTSSAMISILAVIASNISMNVRDRWGEIAVLRTLGFSRYRILRMTIIEGVLLCAVGGTAGLGLAALMLTGIGIAVETTVPGLGMSPFVLFAGLLLICILGGLSSVIPASQATRINISSAFARA